MSFTKKEIQATSDAMTLIDNLLEGVYDSETGSVNDGYGDLIAGIFELNGVSGENTKLTAEEKEEVKESFRGIMKELFEGVITQISRVIDEEF